MKFFFDNNLAPKLARGLNAMVQPEHEIVHLKDAFPADTEDHVWMQSLAGDKKLAIVTADVCIGRNPHEVRAWKEAGHTIFFLKPGWLNLRFWDQANKFTNCFPDLIEEAEDAERGSAFSVSVNGKITPIE